MRALENSFDNAHFSFVHRATFGVASQPRPSTYELVDTEAGFYAETVVPASNPEAFQRISGVTGAVMTRHMRNACYLPCQAIALTPHSGAADSQRIAMRVSSCR